VFADTTNYVQISGTKTKIKTIFPDDGKLTKQEIIQVIKLAKQSGLANPAEVGIFHFLPGGGKGVTVKGMELHDGRNTRFDTVYIYKSGWSFMETNSKSRVMSKFWSDGESKHSTLLRDYKSPQGTLFQVAIGNGVDFGLADILVESYFANKLLSPAEKSKPGNTVMPIGPTTPKDAKPRRICLDDSKTSYEMEFDDYPTTVLKLKFEKEKPVVVGISEYVI
jgi:hypothetical protein